jgi:hypothetical protein
LRGYFTTGPSHRVDPSIRPVFFSFGLFLLVSSWCCNETGEEAEENPNNGDKGRPGTVASWVSDVCIALKKFMRRRQAVSGLQKKSGLDMTLDLTGSRAALPLNLRRRPGVPLSSGVKGEAG